MKKMVLNIGCGDDIRKNAINLDILDGEGVDVVHDLNNGIPFPDNRFNKVIAHHIIEHIPDTIKLMNEIRRVLKPEGIIDIRVPHWTHHSAYTDPTHIRYFASFTFTRFLNKNAEIIHSRIIVTRHKSIGFFMQLIADAFPNFYEGAISRFYPVSEYQVKYKIRK